MALPTPPKANAEQTSEQTSEKPSEQTSEKPSEKRSEKTLGIQFRGSVKSTLASVKVPPLGQGKNKEKGKRVPVVPEDQPTITQFLNKDPGPYRDGNICDSSIASSSTSKLDIDTSCQSGDLETFEYQPLRQPAVAPHSFEQQLKEYELQDECFRSNDFDFLATYREVTGISYFEPCHPRAGAEEAPPLECPIKWIRKKPSDEIIDEPAMPEVVNEPPFAHKLAQELNIPPNQIVRLTLLDSNYQPDKGRDYEVSLDLIPPKQFLTFLGAPNVFCDNPPRRKKHPKTPWPWERIDQPPIMELPSYLHYHLKIFKSLEQFNSHRAKCILDYALRGLQETEEEAVMDAKKAIEESKRPTTYGLSDGVKEFLAETTMTRSQLLKLPAPEPEKTVGFLKQMSKFN